MRLRTATMVLSASLLTVLTRMLMVGVPAMAAGPPPAIAGGQDAAPGQYAFAVKLTMTGLPTPDGGTRDSSCTGALVAARWVITAGHCFRNAYNVRVSHPVARVTTATVGRTDLTSTIGHQVNVIAVRQSPTTDIAIAKLAQPITDIVPIQLNRHKPRIGDAIRLAGYGQTVDRDESSLATNLQTGQFAIVSLDAGYIGVQGRAPRRNTSPCLHDSGGPYFTQHNTDPAVLISVVSHGPSCPHTETDQSARVDAIADWITGVIGRTPRTATPSAAPTRPAAGNPAAGNPAASNPTAEHYRGDDPNPGTRTVVSATVLVAGFGALATLTAAVGNRRRRRRHSARQGVRSHRRRP
jgi:secreted trypsin-like serine protease